ncbi:MAG: hypothetical protein CL799_05965 [Chromatiales bacterium]|jgi:hypothetical protein|nr:hypothetical protein [Chromatiales bacterium]
MNALSSNCRTGVLLCLLTGCFSAACLAAQEELTVPAAGIAFVIDTAAGATACQQTGSTKN